MTAERTITSEHSEQQERKPRLRTLKQAFAGWGELHSVTECIVRDMSETGARLEFKDVGVLPTEFELTIPVDGTICPCRIVWSRANCVGVKFMGLARRSKKHKRDQVLSAYRVDENKIVPRQPKKTKILEPAEPRPAPPLVRPRRQAFGKLGK